MGIVLTHNAKYKPMSFDEMIKPYQIMTEEYRKLEAGIADLEAQAESVKQQALLEPEGSTARKQYEDYAAKLDQAATDLATKGLRGVNRKSVLDLNTQYKSSIKPIEDLIKYRSDIVEEQRKLDPRFVVDRDFSQVTLDELMANPNLGYSKYDLEDYGKQAILEGTSIKAGMKPIYLGKDSTNQNLFYSQGMSDDDLYSWLSGASNEELDAAVDRIVGNAPQTVRDRVKTDLAKSLRATVSKEDNRGYETPAQINSRIKSDNALEAKMIADGFMEGKGGKWIPNPDSPIWVTKGVKYEYVKDENGTIQKDAYGNPIVKPSAGIKPGKASGKSTNTSEKKSKLTSSQSYTILGEYNTTEDELKSGYLGPITKNSISGDIINMADINSIVTQDNEEKASDDYEDILDDANIKKILKNKYNISNKEWRKLSYVKKLNHLKTFIEEMTSPYDMNEHIIQYDPKTGMIKMKAISYSTGSGSSQTSEESSKGTNEEQSPTFDAGSAEPRGN